MSSNEDDEVLRDENGDAMDGDILDEEVKTDPNYMKVQDEEYDSDYGYLSDFDGVFYKKTPHSASFQERNNEL